MRLSRLTLAFCFAVLSTNAVAQATDLPKNDLLKDRNKARLLTVFVPGLGHLYAGEPGFGVAILAVAIVGPAAGYAGYQNEQPDPNCIDTRTADEILRGVESPCAAGGRTQLYLGAAFGLAAWAIGLFDAPRAADRWNAKYGFGTARAEPMIAPGAGGTTRIGLKVNLGR
jgi:hypothetical protein